VLSVQYILIGPGDKFGLNGERPLIGLPYPPISPDGDSLPSLEEVAASLIDAMDEKEFAEPPVLVGYSLGGNIVFEMARQLRKRGKAVGQLVIIDAIPRRLQSISRLALNWAWNRLKGAFTGNRYANRIAGATGSKIKQIFVYEYLPTPIFRPAIKGASASTSSGESERGLRRGQLLRAYLRYRPARYDGSLVLLRAEGRELGWNKLPEDLTWSKYAPSVEVRLIPGTHLELFKAPNVFALADELGRILARSGR
jgi:thioesterase domain-containing protein